MNIAPFKWTVEDGIMVVCSGEGDMSPDQWTKYCADLQTKPISKVLGLNIGSLSMTSTQRKQASEIAKARGMISFVVTDDRMTRGIITAIGWFGANIRAFALSEIDQAIRAMNVGPAIEAKVGRRAAELRHACEQAAKR